MAIILEGFEEILYPRQQLMAAPHQITPLLKRIEQMTYLQQKIKSLKPSTKHPRTQAERLAHQAGESLRRTLVKRRQDELDALPKLRLNANASYVPDITPRAQYSRMRHANVRQ